MKHTHIHTKLNRPSVAHDIVHRDRLIKQLDNVYKQPLTLVSAPAGYGKSTLVSSWMAKCEYPVSWISLEETDSDPVLFLTYLLTAIRSHFPSVALHTETLLEKTPLPSVYELVCYLQNDLEQIATPYIIVLDDYHLVQRESPTDDLLCRILKYPPRSVHIVLLTRQDPTLPIASMRGAGMVKEIRAADLRLTAEEAATFLSNMLQVDIDKRIAVLLEKKTEGWAVGLRLIGLYLQGQRDLEQKIQKLGGSSGYIAEYLVAEVLSRQDPETISFLLETSILKRFCVPLARQIHHSVSQKQKYKREVSAEQFHQWLLDENMFVLGLDNEGYWFRYHHLFRTFLSGMLLKRFSADEIAELHRKAGDWFAENDLIEEAIEHLVASGDVSAATQLIIDHRYELINSSQFVTLIRLLEKLPKKAVSESPLLTTTKAFIGLDMGIDEDMYGYTQIATQMLQKLCPQSEVYAEVRGEVNILQSLIEMILGNAERSLVYAQEGLSDLPEYAMMIRSLGIGVLSISHQMKRNIERAVAVIKEALSNPNWPANIRARIHFYLSIVQYMDANPIGVMTASHECLQAARDLSFNHTRAFACYFLGVGHYLRNELDAAASNLLKVLDSRHAVNPSYVAHASFILTCIRLSQGEESAADRVLEQIIAYCREIGNVTVLSITQAFEAEYGLRRGDFPQAQQICKHADFEARPPLWFFYVPQLTPIKCLLAEGTENSLKNARSRLIEWDEQMHRINRNNVRIEILALLALVCHKQSDEAAALGHLQTALKLAEPGKWIRTFVDLGDHMTELLLQYNRQNAGQSFAQTVLQASQAEHAQQAFIKSETASEKQMSDFFNMPALTERESEIIPLLAEGLSNKEIAERLCIAPYTVKTHLKNIYKKLVVKNRIEAIIAANNLTPVSPGKPDRPSFT